jgi:hypothetical protein
VQTFLPYPDFVESARSLDRARLGKQRVEAWQIISVIRKIRMRRLAEDALKERQWLGKLPEMPGWGRHPAVLMWSYEPIDACLAQYGFVMCDEWKKRGYRDNMAVRFESVIEIYTKTLGPNTTKLCIDTGPWWLGNEKFHRSHRAALYSKDPLYYEDFQHDGAVTCCLSCNYYWPTHVGGSPVVT